MEPNTARRRIAKGAFIAPMIWTLPTGSAIAASSSLRCLTNQGYSGAQAPAVSPMLDSYVRVQGYVDDEGNHYVSGSSLGQFVATGTNLPGIGEWSKIEMTTGRVIETTFQQPVGIRLSGKYIAVRFDSTGHIVALGGEDAGVMVTQSCWASVMPTLGA